jgi:hypothetical protein
VALVQEEELWVVRVALPVVAQLGGSVFQVEVVQLDVLVFRAEAALWVGLVCRLAWSAIVPA